MTAPPRSESTLLMQARGGDTHAFIELMERIRPRVWGVCLNIVGNHHDAEDAYQEALVAAWQNLDKFRGDSQFASWLYRLAANAALQIIRRRNPVSDLTDFTDPQVVSLPARDFTAQVDARATLRVALTDLPEQFRVALVLREFGDLTIREIADHQGVAEATVKTRLHRARRHVLDQIRQRT